MKKTIISAAIVGLSLAGFKNDMDKAGDWYDKHQGAVDGAATTAAQIGKIIAGAQNDNQFGVEQRAEWAAKHAGDIAKVAGMFGDENDDELGVKQRAEWEWKHRKAIGKILRAVGDQNDDELGVKQRAEFMAKHGRTIAKIAGMFGDANDDQLESIGKKAWHFFENGPELELGFKGDMDKAGDWYDKHQGAVDGAATTAAQIGKIIAGAQNDNEFGVKQRAEFMAKHGRTIAKIASMFGDANDDELSFQSVTTKIGEVLGDVGDAAKIGKIFADSNDDELSFKSVTTKIGEVLGDVGDAAKIGKIIADSNDDEFSFKSVVAKVGDAFKNIASGYKTVAGDQNEVNDYLSNDNNLSSLRGLEVPVRRGFLGGN